MQENMINHNIIIKEPCKNLRSLGRNALKNKWKISIIAVIVYLLFMQIPPIVFDAIFGTSVGQFLTINGNTYGMDAGTFSQVYNSMPQYCILSSIYTILVTGAMQLGITIFFLATFRKHDVKVVEIFLGFEKFGKALGLMIFIGIFTFLWSLLFIIPGIIASIRYSQAFFILADDPSKGIRQCVNESKAMLKGNKGKYFLLSLSFIGWAFLCGIPQGLIQSMGTIISNNDFIIAIFNVIGGLCMAPLLAYVFSTLAGFYEILSGHLIKETRPVPVTPEEAQQVFAELDAEAAKEQELLEEAPADEAPGEELPEEAELKNELVEGVESIFEEKSEEKSEDNNE